MEKKFRFFIFLYVYFRVWNFVFVSSVFIGKLYILCTVIKDRDTGNLINIQLTLCHHKQ